MLQPTMRSTKKWLKKCWFNSKRTLKNKISLSLTSQRSVLAAVFLFTLLMSCKKDNGELGMDVLPDEDILNGTYVDTFSLITYTEAVDSLRTDELSRNMLGSYWDPVFGKTSAGFYTQVRLSANNPTFDVPNIVIDSVVLSFVYDDYYGNLDAQTFNVYEILDTLYSDSAYYSNQTLNADITDLAAAQTIVPDVDSYVFFPDGDSAKPQLRLKLNNSIGQKVINESGTGNLSDNDAFTKFLKGFYITVDNPSQTSGQGAILYLNTEDADSKMTIYYRDINLSDTLEFDLIINDNCARFTKITHDYSLTAVEDQLNDSTLGQQYFYLQAGAGLTSVVKFPSVTNLNANGPIIVNRAELIVPVQFYTIDPLSPPDKAFIFGIDSLGESYITKDQSINYTGDPYDDSKKEYVFTLTRHVNDLLTGKQPNNGMRILAGSGAVSANRVIFSGPSSPNRAKPYLKITYTKY